MFFVIFKLILITREIFSHPRILDSDLPGLATLPVSQLGLLD